MTSEPNDKLILSSERWQELLSPDQFAVLRQQATERPGSSRLNDEHRSGTFLCAGCHQPLFSSRHKFDSGSGWPSFFRPLGNSVIETRRDTRHGMTRLEYHCARCGGHQGHVFSDGPQPTGQRWCNNGLALKFVPEGEKLPGLRKNAYP